ncbi:ATP-dependent zinc metalloprotease FtsH 3 [Dissostichus eleginoides]|uniref:ATP-dependent zinc metalloprotease FtsH 3 n=1 Tax=Dissostichus eleginoides TaxID=100907 RepID=A0AAD9ESW0_DISEL|nr:ATP-dependent zinc metalloprotease FtsH 3 [Dissostichus eleginoides]
MNDAQQEMSPDFVLMRLVSDRLEDPEARRTSGGGSLKAGHHGFDPERSGLGSPHYSSPLPGKRQLNPGSPRSSDPQEDFAAAAQRFVKGGSRAQLMVFQNLLQEERLLDSGAGSGPGGGGDSAEETLRRTQQESPGLDPDPGSVLAQWPPELLDQALRLLEPRNAFSGSGGDPVLVLARRLGQLGEEGGSRCSCHREEDPGETSDALLVLDELGSEGSEGTLKDLMQQVHRLAQENGVFAPDHLSSPPQNQNRSSTPKLGLSSGVLEGPGGDRKARGKSRSLKVRLSKLFRTKSSSGGASLLEKRPSLASSTSSGGGRSLLEGWGSTCSSER